jgi:hypothetical protein
VAAVEAGVSQIVFVSELYDEVRVPVMQVDATTEPTTIEATIDTEVTVEAEVAELMAEVDAVTFADASTARIEAE